MELTESQIKKIQNATKQLSAVLSSINRNWSKKINSKRSNVELANDAISMLLELRLSSASACDEIEAVLAQKTLKGCKCNAKRK